jgi:hypothetical protein
MSYTRLRLFWGAVDLTAGSGTYTSGERVSAGASAVEGVGIGLRRAHLEFTQTPPGTIADDVRVMHFDFVNLTGGSPDDTWTDGDYSTLDGHINDWWTAIKPDLTTELTFSGKRFYRVGPGIVPPNPAEKVITGPGTAGGSSTGALPPQDALSITLKTADRKRWGRTYLPGLPAGHLAAHGVADGTILSDVGAATDALIAAAAADDFVMVVYSPTTSGAHTVESIQVDNIVDVIRSRRWRNATAKYTTP